MTTETSITLAQTSALAKKFDISGDPQELIHTLKATVFKGNATDEQFTALLIVASQYGLNPFTKEIYAFPDINNGIVPVVGVDGWARILNNNPQFDGMEFEQNDESCTCKIYCKDRNHPTVVTEFMSECKRDIQGPWKSHPKRMLCHKAMIQAARLAFGFAGIYDQDEAERINESQVNSNNANIDPSNGKPTHPEYEMLIQAAEKSANLGLETYKNFWANRLTAEQRKIIGLQNHERFKAIAENTIVAETIQESESEHDAAAN